VTTVEREKFTRLRREARALPEKREILKQAADYFASKTTR
jgi:hypothetical protein